MPLPQRSAISSVSQTEVFITWLVAIFALKWPALSEPPVGDAAFGLFPAAGALADSGFNVWSLLHQPTYFEGGPNCHADSIVTWGTAALLWMMGKGANAFVVLHLLHFGMAAWTLTILHRLASSSLGRSTSLMMCVALLLCPLFRVQVGAMYFEIPLAACTVAATEAYAERKLGRAVAWSTLAVMVKQAGLVVAGALAVAALIRRDSMTQRLGLAIRFAGLGLVATFWPLLTTPLLASMSDPTPSNSWWDFLGKFHIPYLLAIPDIVAGCGIVALLGLWQIRDVWHSLASVSDQVANSISGAPADGSLPDGSKKCLSGHSDRLPTSAWGVSYLIGLMFALFFFVTPYPAQLAFYCLPRYFVSILPCVFFAGAQALATLTSPRLTTFLWAVVALFFIGNRDGIWYPSDVGNNIAVQERSENYRGVVAVQRESVQVVSNLPDDAIIFYGLPEHYFLQHSWLGYSSRRHPGGRCVALAAERHLSLNQNELPEHYYVLLDAPSLGDRELQSILRQARNDPSRQVQLFRQCQRGPFRAEIYEVTTSLKPPVP